MSSLANQPPATHPFDVCPRCLARRLALRDRRRGESLPWRPPLLGPPPEGPLMGLAYFHV